MSDGGFDVDQFMQQSRGRINLFGIGTDPITKQRVSFPSISRNYSQNQTQIDYSVSSKKHRGNKTTSTSIYSNQLQMEIDSSGIKYEVECKNCIHFNECKLKDGFDDICPHKSKRI